MVFEPQYAHGIKRSSTKLLQSLYYAPLIKNIITCNGKKSRFRIYIIARSVHLAFVAEGYRRIQSAGMVYGRTNATIGIFLTFYSKRASH